MKHLLIITFCLWGVAAQAQSLSKSEKKAIKKELKQYKKSPETFKSYKQKNKNTIEEQETIIEDLSRQLGELRQEQNNLRDSIAALAAAYAELKKLEDARGTVPEGVVYQVQLGLYERLDLKSFNREGLTVRAEEQQGAKRYVVGFFRNLDDAKRFNKDVQKLGIKDAFVSKYVDGVKDMSFDANKVK